MRVPKLPFGCMNATVVPRLPGRGALSMGVAPAATVVPVRVLDCTGSGFTSGVIAGIDWAIADHAAGAPAVLNMSLGGGASSALDAAGYPPRADMAAVNFPMVIALCAWLVLLVTMVYGPIAAWLVELFPTRIRYTSMSLPYHLGNGWFGGFLPVTSFAIVAATGDIYAGLWYPVGVALVTAVIGTLFLADNFRQPIDN